MILLDKVMKMGYSNRLSIACLDKPGTAYMEVCLAHNLCSACKRQPHHVLPMDFCYRDIFEVKND